MSGLSESMWANAPDVSSTAPRPNAAKPPRAPRVNNTDGAQQHGARRRGRGGGGGGGGNKPPAAKADAPVASATASSTPSAPHPTSLPPRPQSTTNDAPKPSLPPRPRGGPKRTASSNTKAPAAAAQPPSSTSTPQISGSTESHPKSTPSRSDTSAPTSASTPAASTLPKKPQPKRRQSKPNNHRRRSSLAISVVSGTSEPPSTIIEPPTPLSPMVEGSTFVVTTGPEEMEGPSSPKAASHSSSGPETLPPATPLQAEPLINFNPLRPSTPASASVSHLDWADEDEGDDLPTLDDWGVKPSASLNLEELAPQKTPQAVVDEPVVAPKEVVVDEQATPKVELAPPVETTTASELEVTTAQSVSESAHSEEVLSTSEAASDEAKAPSVASSRAPGRSNNLHRPPLTDEMAAEKRKAKNRQARERRKVVKAHAKAEAGLPPTDPAAASTSAASSANPPNLPSAAPMSAPADSANASFPSSISAPADLSLPTRPAPPSNGATAPPTPSASFSSGFPPNRRPFGGDPAFMRGHNRGGSSDFGGSNNGGGGFRTRGGRGGRGRGAATHVHVAHGHKERPVLSPNALSQLSKSLSGGARVHKPTPAPAAVAASGD
ncbi:hypothetical protein DL93DRAFT_455433 [Clavulina sp. PMI_390]|nr:hypothetical protein DL93DRAFT_455433 [Clavulina sp. PMI_390]